MRLIPKTLVLCGRKGRYILVLGLICGITMPQTALFLKEHLYLAIALLLFLAALRIGPQKAFAATRNIKAVMSFVLVAQLIFPLVLWALFATLGIEGTYATALILMGCAATIGGAANIVILTGNNPAPALNILVLGTALLPLTVIPTFLLIPELGSVWVVATSVMHLLSLIFVATAAAFGIRFLFEKYFDEQGELCVDGLSAITMSVMVVGLMSAVGPALSANPFEVLKVLAIASFANFGLQLLVWFLMPQDRFENERASFAITAGNRNIALFLASLPLYVTDPLLLFIGCYQIPMFLTPMALGWLYKTKSGKALNV